MVSVHESDQPDAEVTPDEIEALASGGRSFTTRKFAMGEAETERDTDTFGYETYVTAAHGDLDDNEFLTVYVDTKNTDNVAFRITDSGMEEHGGMWFHGKTLVIKGTTPEYDESTGVYSSELFRLLQGRLAEGQMPGRSKPRPNAPAEAINKSTADMKGHYRFGRSNYDEFVRALTTAR